MNRKTFGVSVTDLGEREILFKISDNSQDRDEDIMEPLGCDFANFAKNPQFLGFHNYYDFPLGTPRKWWADSSGVYSIVYFPTVAELSTEPAYASEKAKLVDTTYCMYKAGMLSAVSIGFDPKEMSPNPKSETGYGKLIKKWELYEFSAVPVPANPNAVAQGIKSGAISATQAKQWQEVIEKTVKQKEEDVDTKSGKRHSAKDKASLDAIADSHDKIGKALTKAMEQHQAIGEQLKSLLDSQEEPDDDGNDDQDDLSTQDNTENKTVLVISE